MMTVKLIVFLFVFLPAVFCGSIKADDILDAQNVWLSVQEQWDMAVNAETSVLRENALTALGNSLKTNTVWTGAEFTPTTLSGKTAVLNYIRNVEAPAYENSTRFTASMKSSSSKIQGVERITFTFLVNHHQTKVASAQNTLPEVFYEIERLTVIFVQQSGNWLIESLNQVIIKSEKDDLIAEILALRAENQQLQQIADAADLEAFKAASHKATIEELYRNVRYPFAQQIIQSGSLPSFFDPNVKGRIHPVGFFTEIEDVVEYFYGLSPTPSGQSGSIIAHTNVVHFANDGQIAASETILTFQRVNGSNPVNLTQKGFWRFDDEDRIIEFDLEIVNLGLWAKARGNQYDNPQYQAATIASLCPTIQNICTGPNQQYDSVASCTSFLTGINFGTPDQYWSNSVSCRTVHLVLAAIRPAIHCSHVGPTGGGKCVDRNYTDFYTITLFPDAPDRLIGV